MSTKLPWKPGVNASHGDKGGALNSQTSSAINQTDPYMDAIINKLADPGAANTLSL